MTPRRLASVVDAKKTRVAAETVMSCRSASGSQHEGCGASGRPEDASRCREGVFAWQALLPPSKYHPGGGKRRSLGTTCKGLTSFRPYKQKVVINAMLSADNPHGSVLPPAVPMDAKAARAHMST